MARVLVVNPGSEGHINPTIGVVQELVRRGEAVVYFASEQFRERLEAVGAKGEGFYYGVPLIVMPQAVSSSRWLLTSS